GRLSFLQARRTVRISPCELGSLSRKTALVARIRRSPVRVLTMSAPNGEGRAVFRVRAVNSKISRMRSSSSAAARDDLAGADLAMPQFSTPRAWLAAGRLFNFCIGTIRLLPAKRRMLFCSADSKLDSPYGPALFSQSDDIFIRWPQYGRMQ